MHVPSHASTQTHTFTHSTPLTYTQTQFIWGKCDLRRQAATTSRSIRVPGVALVAIVKQIILCDWKKKDNPKGHLWPLGPVLCSICHKQAPHVCVKWQKVCGAVSLPCNKGLYVRSITAAVALTGLSGLLVYLQKIQKSYSIHHCSGTLNGWSQHGWHALIFYSFYGNAENMLYI